MKSISKELFIMALLLMIVVFMLGMVFYKYMPNNKTVPEPVTYTADSSTTSVLQEISASTSYSGSYDEEDKVQDVIKSYSIGTQELTTAASKQTYVSGKTDPFAEYQAANANTTNSNTTGNTTTNNTTTNTTAAATTNTNSSSTGTFFEKKGSK